MENVGNDFATTLNGGIDNVQTGITVASSTGAPSANFRIRIDDELMLVTSLGSGLNWTVTRGVEGSTAALHSNGAAVVHVLSAGGVDTLLGDRGWLYDEVEVDTDGMVVAAGRRWVIDGDMNVAGLLDLKGTVVVL